MRLSPALSGGCQGMRVQSQSSALFRGRARSVAVQNDGLAKPVRPVYQAPRADPGDPSRGAARVWRSIPERRSHSLLYR
jgi:hypothetical protein